MVLPARPGPRSVMAAAPWGFPAALLLVTVAAGVQRTRGLDAEGLSSDEAVYLGQGLGLTGQGDWSPVRAHPPLLGLLVQLVPGGTTGELVPRGLCVLLGLVGVVVAGLLGRELAGRTGGLLAAAALAWMPYHGDVTRLALVDVPMATLVAVGLLLAVRAARQGRPALVEVAAVVLGVATLFKETAALSVAALAVAMAAGDLPGGRRTVLRSALWYSLVVAAYPAFLVARGGVGTGADYLRWQVGRLAADPPAFYLDTVAPRVGVVVLLLAALGAAALLARRQRGVLTVALAVVVPVAFYALWPVRGYPYLLACAVPLAALTGAGAATLARGLLRRPRLLALPTVTAALLLGASGAGAVSAAPPPVPGASGVPGVREAARWVAARPSVPVVTAAPWVANVVRYYAPTARVAALGAPSTDQARLNPAYRRRGVEVLPPGEAVVVWDVWSSHTDPEGTARLLHMVRARGGRVAHVETGARPGAEPQTEPTVLVVVFVLDS